MSLEANLERVRQRIEAACSRAGRNPLDVTMVAVSKGHPPATVDAAADLGLTLFGENRVQEARAKIGRCPGNLEWHLIGSLQSNKCRDAVHFFKMIHSVDRFELAEELEKWAARGAKPLPVLLQVNVAGESSKHGYAPDHVIPDLDRINALDHLEIHGLMTIAPWSEDPEKIRPVFRRLAELKMECEQHLGAPLPHLSMGMSGDFEVAVEEGATMVRLGTILFGPRGKAASR